MVRHYSMPSEPAMDVTAGEPDTGTEAGLVLVVDGSSSTSRRYSDSAKSLPPTNADSRGTENAWARILCGVRSGRGGRPPVLLVCAGSRPKYRLCI